MADPAGEATIGVPIPTIPNQEATRGSSACRSRRLELRRPDRRARAAQELDDSARDRRRRPARRLHVHPFADLASVRDPRARRTSPSRSSRSTAARTSASSTRRRRRSTSRVARVTTAGGRRARLRLPLHRHRPAPGVREDRGTRPRGRLHRVGLQPRARSSARGTAWKDFLKDPGPVVVGTAQGGSCFGASYEFLFNVKHQIKKAGLEDVAPVTFISAEPELGHFGLGGVGNSHDAGREVLRPARTSRASPNSSIDRVTADEIAPRGRPQTAVQVLDDRARRSAASTWSQRRRA